MCIFRLDFIEIFHCHLLRPSTGGSGSTDKFVVALVDRSRPRSRGALGSIKTLGNRFFPFATNPALIFLIHHTYLERVVTLTPRCHQNMSP